MDERQFCCSNIAFEILQEYLKKKIYFKHLEIWVWNSREGQDLESQILVLSVYKGSVKGMELPRDSRKRKNIISITCIRKHRFECQVPSLTSSGDLNSYFSQTESTTVTLLTTQLLKTGNEMQMCFGNPQSIFYTFDYDIFPAAPIY